MKVFIFFILLFFCSIHVSAQDAAATGISRAFNPAISVNCLFDGMASNESEILWNEIGLDPGLHYQEISLEISSNVDVYLNSKVVISASEADGLGIEEAYLTTLSMPIPITIRGGQMFSTFGRHNLYHLHHMAFAEVPMIHQQIFGPDLNEMGLEASYLMPVSWYMDATIGILNGDNPYLFNAEKQHDFAYLFHLDNLWDLSDEYTLRLGGSYLTGKRSLFYSDEKLTAIGVDTSKIMSQTFGFDFQLKWRPLRFGRYHSFTLQGEYINTTLNIDEKRTDPLHGFFVQALAQFKLNWWLQARYGWFERSKELHRFFPEPINLNYTKNNNLIGKRYSFAVSYVSTEFSAYRLQYNIIDLGGHSEQQIVAQVNVTIGSHPAHKY